ncbi:MAG TPA: tetratricopeptide repeat protein [Verrucomicrobiota bacterium]|nr:tetratricopeptide repeat protein [Verrucomicrobiota bacterium]HQL78867.1 tetratricopeptide repeat protein [Verrucomicrobiota bacterium]
MTERTKTLSALKAGSRAGRPAWRERLERPGVLCLLLAVATLAVFLPVAWQGFVNYDDSDYVTENAHVQSGLKWANVVWAFTTGHASNWHPLTWLSHMVDCQLFGLEGGWHHMVSVGLHIANSLLLLLLLRRMTGALWRSALVAALFALHPLHVESVAWASERKDVLSTLFFLLTVRAYVEYAESRRQLTERGISRRVSAYYLLALGCFALGLMSKPMLVTLPFVLLLLDYWPLMRLGSLKSGARNGGRPSPPLACLLSLLLEKVPFLLLAAASSAVTYVVQHQGGAVSTSLTLGERIANALVSYARYFGKMLWPKDLSILYPHPGHWPMWQVIGSAVLLLAVFAGVVLAARRRPYLAVGWLWFCGTLVPVIGLVQVGIQSMADRYTYVPLIGLFIMLAWGVDALVPARPWRGKALALGAGLALAACALLTARQVRFWRDSEALFGHAVQVTRDNYLAYNNLGFYLSGRGRTAEAMEHYRMALKIKPSYEDALNNLGHALAGQRRFGEAIPLYEAALRVRPKHAEVHNNLGNALSEVGRVDEAIQHYLIVLEQKPDHADAHNNLGIALAMKGKLDEAISHFHEAIRCKPGYASAHSNLGNALAVQRKLDEAIKEYQIALRLKPEDAQAHNNLGNALAEQGKTEEAIAHYRAALRLRADNPEAHFNLALGLLRQGKREDAAAHLTEALRLRPDYAEARRQLDSLGSSGRN